MKYIISIITVFIIYILFSGHFESNSKPFSISLTQWYWCHPVGVGMPLLPFSLLIYSSGERNRGYYEEGLKQGAKTAVGELNKKENKNESKIN